MLGGGSGFIFDMIARVKANSALSRKQRYFRTARETYLKWKKEDQKGLHFPKATPEQMNALRLKLSRQRKRKQRIHIVVLLVTVILTAGFIWATIYGLLIWVL